MSRRPSLKHAIDVTENAELSNENSFGNATLQSSKPGEDRRGVLVRVDADVRRRLKIVAINRGVTVQDLLIEAIAAILEEPNSPRP